MSNKLSMPVPIAIAVVAVVILVVVAWRTFAPERIPRDAKGNPTQAAPGKAQSGFNAMQDLFQQGVKPPKQGGPR